MPTIRTYLNILYEDRLRRAFPPIKWSPHYSRDRNSWTPCLLAVLRKMFIISQPVPVPCIVFTVTVQSKRIVDRRSVCRRTCSAGGHLDRLLSADAHEAAALGDGGLWLGDLLNLDLGLGCFGLLGGRNLPGLWSANRRLWCVERGPYGADRVRRRDGLEALRERCRRSDGCLLTSAGVRLGTTVGTGPCQGR